MTPLTLENAGELESGEIYQIGINATNVWDGLFIVFDRVDHYEYDLGQADLAEYWLKTGLIKQEPGKMSHQKQIDNLRKLWIFGWQGGSVDLVMDKVGFDEKPGRIAYEASPQDTGEQITKGCDDSYFCIGSGAEPLWILEDGETWQDIPRPWDIMKEIMQCK